jgi:hypothetical protein
VDRGGGRGVGVLAMDVLTLLVLGRSGVVKGGARGIGSGEDKMGYKGWGGGEPVLWDR